MYRGSKTLAMAACAAAAVTVAVLVGGPGEAPKQAAAQTSSSAVVWAAGDVATSGSAPDRVARMIRDARPNHFLYLGDVYERGTATEFKNHYEPRLGSLAGITLPTIGNHEWSNRHTGYYPYWRSKKGTGQAAWERKRIAGWDILNMNSQAPRDAGSDQDRWLDQQLKARSGDCRIAFWHRPRYTAGHYDNSGSMDYFWRKLSGKAKLVLSGHDHNLQRHHAHRGLVQYVVGAGGRKRYSLDTGDSSLAWGNDSVDGALRMVLSPGRATVEFRTVDGRVHDRRSYTCTSG